MPKPYSKDLRLKSLSLINDGKNILEVAELLKISRSSLYLWQKKQREEGDVTPKKGNQNGHSHKIKNLDFFKKFVDENHDLTATDMAEKWGNISIPTICKWLKRIGYTRKKKLTDIRSDAKSNAKYIWTT